jgi:hypothetical protein
MTFEEFWKRFTELEAKHALLSSRIAGQQLYALRRVKFFYAVAVALGIYSDPHPGGSDPADKPKPISLDFAGVPETSVVVIPFRRLVGGVDPYSQTVADTLKNSAHTPAILEWDWISRVQQSARVEARNGLVGKVTRKLTRGGIDAKWDKVVSLFEKEFGVELSHLALPKALLLNLEADVRAFSDYFKRAKVQKLYLVDAYSNQWLVLAAHAAGVKVSEIQHGFVNEFHPAYSYPLGSPKLDHTPDELLVWGKFWADEVSLPTGMIAKVSGASKQFNETRAKLAKFRRDEQQVLFTSQGAVSVELQKAAVAAAKSLPDFKVVYRLHPNEDLASYPTENLPKNFSYSHKTPVFLELLAESAYLVGAFSTTLYEGMALGAKVLVLPLPGFENMNRAIANGDVTVITDIERIGESIRAAKPAANPDNYYAKENPL